MRVGIHLWGGPDRVWHQCVVPYRRSWECATRSIWLNLYFGFWTQSLSPASTYAIPWIWFSKRICIEYNAQNKTINCSFSIESNHPPALHLTHGSFFHFIKEKKLESKMRMYSPNVQAAPIIKPRFLQVYQRILLDSTDWNGPKNSKKTLRQPSVPKVTVLGVTPMQGVLATSKVAWQSSASATWHAWRLVMGKVTPLNESSKKETREPGKKQQRKHQQQQRRQQQEEACCFEGARVFRFSRNKFNDGQICPSPESTPRTAQKVFMQRGCKFVVHKRRGKSVNTAKETSKESLRCTEKPGTVRWEHGKTSNEQGTNKISI